MVKSKINILSESQIYIDYETKKSTYFIEYLTAMKSQTNSKRFCEKCWGGWNIKTKYSI